MAVNGAGKPKLNDSPYETRLVARFQAGEPEALAALFDLHVDRVFAYARHLLNNREDAEEVTTEAFLRAFQRAATFRGECGFRGWLFSITRNLCWDRRKQPRLLQMEPEEAERISDGGRTIEQAETAAVVRRALEGLPEEYRVVLTLCDVEQWDAKEVAFMLDKTLSATKSMLYRARRALREHLAELWDDGDNEAFQEGEGRNAL